MAEEVMIEADVTFLPKSEGGREFPDCMFQDRQYRPHLVLGDPMQRKVVSANESYLGVAFNGGPQHIELGQSVKLTMILVYWPSVNYEAAKPEATFTIREGKQIVGFGKITKRWTEK